MKYSFSTYTHGQFDYLKKIYVLIFFLENRPGGREGGRSLGPLCLKRPTVTLPIKNRPGDPGNLVLASDGIKVQGQVEGLLKSARFPKIRILWSHSIGRWSAILADFKSAR